MEDALADAVKEHAPASITGIVMRPRTGEILAMASLPNARGRFRSLKDIENLDDYDAILIPGGLFSPDKLRTEKDALRFASSFVNQRKPVFAICHGPQVLISAGAAKDRRMTGVKSIQKDLANAGADVSDEAVVVDDGLVTSRTPDDLDAFNAKSVEAMTETKHDRHQKHFGFAFF